MVKRSKPGRTKLGQKTKGLGHSSNRRPLVQFPVPQYIHTYIYIYMYIDVCMCVYIYIFFSKIIRNRMGLQNRYKFVSFGNLGYTFFYLNSDI
jgi:hypothetical protein